MFDVIRTPLMLACAKDNLEIIKFLVNNKADLDQVNKDDWNALHIAVRLIFNSH